MTVNESAENYLETILILSNNSPVVRSIDVATELNYKKSSVSVAMKNLRKKEYITISDEGYIFLTEAGKKIANMVYEKHTFLSGWLELLGVDSKIASEDACRIEHVISNDSFEAIKKYVKNSNPNINL
jgi:DtxR family transcriptional regulator, Mn-dependent transcriptional regulator